MFSFLHTVKHNVWEKLENVIIWFGHSSNLLCE